MTRVPNRYFKLLLVAALVSAQSLAFAQSLLTQPSTTAQRQSVPAPSPAASSASLAASAPKAAPPHAAKAGLPSVASIIAAAAASATVPTQPAVDKAADKAQPVRARSTVSAPSAPPDPSDVAQRPNSPTVVRRPDGTQVFRTPVTPTMLEEEQRVAAQMRPPAAVSPKSLGDQSPVKPAAKPTTALASFLGAEAGAPEWVTDGVTKTNGKTRLMVSQGVTEMVAIARNFPNRFITPFESAEVITTDDNLSHEGVGGAVILATSGDKPIGVFIQDKYSDRSIGLVLIPENLPQRELRLVLDDTWTSPVLRPNTETSDVQLPTAQSDYVDYVKSMLRALAKGEVPDGHALTPLDVEQVPKCQIPGIAAKPAQMLEGPTSRIAVYVATNTSSSSLPVQEAGCYRRGVLAVSAFPRPVLEPGQSTELYVLMRKDVVTQTITGKRRPVLVSQ